MKCRRNVEECDGFHLPGFYGEPLDLGSVRHRQRGLPLADGWTGCFAGFKADLKARVECHRFRRTFQSTSLCDLCLAQQPFKNSDNTLNAFDFTDGAAWRDTMISTSVYLRHDPRPSPWTAIRGWCLELNWYDDMHNYLLGTLKDHAASAIISLLEDGLLGTGAPNTCLKELWIDGKGWCKVNNLKAPRSQAHDYTYLKVWNPRWGGKGRAG